jgi:hypothetical protein
MTRQTGSSPAEREAHARVKAEQKSNLLAIAAATKRLDAAARVRAKADKAEQAAWAKHFAKATDASLASWQAASDAVDKASVRELLACDSVRALQKEQRVLDSGDRYTTLVNRISADTDRKERNMRNLKAANEANAKARKAAPKAAAPKKPTKADAERAIRAALAGDGGAAGDKLVSDVKATTTTTKAAPAKATTTKKETNMATKAAATPTKAAARQVKQAIDATKADQSETAVAGMAKLYTKAIVKKQNEAYKPYRRFRRMWLNAGEGRTIAQAQAVVRDRLGIEQPKAAPAKSTRGRKASSK